MKRNLHSAIIALLIILTPFLIFGQAPDLGGVSNFAVFTAVGAFNNTGATIVNGDIGTNVGEFNGFPPGIVNGSTHVSDAMSAVAATDVALAYGILSTATCGSAIGTTLGGGQILFPDVYCSGAASTLTGDLILDGQGDANSIFIFKIDGALSTSTFSNIILTNSASLCNVYWQVNGQFELGEGSNFSGNVLANGAVILLEGASLTGRALSVAGAVSLHNNLINLGIEPVAAMISATGLITFCEGSSVLLSGNIDGTWSNGSTESEINVTVAGDYFVTNTTNCGSIESNHIVVVINPLPVCLITGGLIICEGESTQLCVASGASSYLWSNGATTNCITVSIAGIYSVTITSADGCFISCSEEVIVNPVPACAITGGTFICEEGQTTQLCVASGASSYLWSNGSTTNCITVSTAGIYSVTITSADGCSSNCSQEVIVNATSVCSITGNPMICQGESTQLCTPAGAAGYLWSNGATTNCITVSTEGLYSVTITSASGCTSNCEIQVTVNPPPVCLITGGLIICEGESTQLCVASGASSYLWSNGETTSCINVSLAGIYSVTILSVNGCTSSCSEEVIINEGAICSISGDDLICEGGTTQLCAQAGALSYLWSTGETTSCIIVSAMGLYSVTITSVSGCISSCEHFVNMNDTTAPVLISCPADIQIDCLANVPVIDVTQVSAFDECSSVSTEHLSDVMTGNDCIGRIERVYRTYDSSGNFVDCVQTISYSDNVPPVFLNPPTDVILNCDDVPLFEEVSATDNCSIAVVTFVESTLSAGCEFVIQRVYTATDACGNASTFTQTIHVTDTTNPTYAVFNIETSAECDDVNNVAGPVFADNCSEVSVTYSDAIYSGGCLGVIARLWIATDACGNTTTVEQYITILDTTVPELINVPSDTTMECSEVPTAVDGILFGAGDVVGFDLCGVPVVVTYSEETMSGICADNYFVIRTWVATDYCENQFTASQTITVQDTTAPNWNQLLEDITVQCSEELPSVIYPTASDNCATGIEVVLTETTLQGDCAEEYTIERMFTAPDNCGNYATQVQLIHVVDTTPPIFTFVPESLVVECSMEIPLLMATAEDVCSTVTVDFSDGPHFTNELCPQAFSFIRTFTATDACGNSASAMQLINVVDTTAPVVIGVIDVNIPCDESSDVFITATDNCGVVNITYTDVPVSGGCAGSSLREYLVTDNCGNVATFMQIITFIDNVAPVITVASDVTIECTDVIPNAFYEASDNCDDSVIVSVTEEELEGDCPQNYTIVRTYTATDHCQNTTQVVQHIQIVDTTAPVFVDVPSDVVYSCVELVPELNATAIDNCSNVVVTWSDENVAGSCPANYTIIRSFIATDDCGNVSIATQTIIVHDTIAPVFTFIPESSVVECSMEVPLLMATAEDICSTVTIDFSDGPHFTNELCPQAYSFIRTFTATDACGNSANAMQLINVVDTTAPIFDQLVSDDVLVECAEDVPAVAELTASDNCSNVEIEMVATMLSMDDCGNYIRNITYYANDECGNFATQSYTITVSDTTPPVFIDPAADLVIDCLTSIPAAITPLAADNCVGLLETTFVEEVVGNAPTPGSIADCSLSTPMNIDPGWSLALHTFPLEYRFYSTVSAQFVEFPDGTAHLVGNVVSNMNPNAGWVIDIWFMNGMNWADWSTQFFPTSYKNDSGFAENNYLDWTYYIMNGSSSTLLGTGDLVGSYLTLSHAPANLYYAFQVGIAANTLNAEYGSAGWIAYSGIHQNSQLQGLENGVFVSGIGDIAFDANCCVPYSILRTWTASDCSGNTVSTTQVISIQDTTIPIPIIPQINPSVLLDGNEIMVSHIFPNPSNGFGKMEFTAAKDMRITIDVFDMLGHQVANVFGGLAKGGIVNIVNLDGSALGGGMYIVKLKSMNDDVTQKWLIQK